MGIIHIQVSFFAKSHAWTIDYYAHGVGELQDQWRREMDPLCGWLRPIGVSYQISQIVGSKGGEI